jgi:hypothetical protein
VTKEQAFSLNVGDRVQRVDQIDEYGIVVAIGFGQVDIRWDVEHPECGRPFTERHDEDAMDDIEKIEEVQ